jgi:hypothetical protein
MRRARQLRTTLGKLLLAGAMLLAQLAVPSGRAGANSVETPLRPFGPGETCTFSIGYGIVTAGEATISVEDIRDYYGSSVYHLRTRARSNRFFDPFFKVRDQADSYLDVDSLYSRYYFKQMREGDYRREVEIHFDHEAGIAYFPSGKETEIPPDVQDVLSAFFRVRTLKLTDGEEIKMPTHGDRRLYDLVVKVHGRERLDTILGDVTCIKVQPVLAEEGLFKNEGDLFVWLTDDDRRIPVRMKANVPVGAIEAKLTSYVPPRETGVGVAGGGH